MFAALIKTFYLEIQFWGLNTLKQKWVECCAQIRPNKIWIDFLLSHLPSSHHCPLSWEEPTYFLQHFPFEKMTFMPFYIGKPLNFCHFSDWLTGKCTKVKLFWQQKQGEQSCPLRGQCHLFSSVQRLCQTQSCLQTQPTGPGWTPERLQGQLTNHRSVQVFPLICPQ